MATFAEVTENDNLWTMQFAVSVPARVSATCYTLSECSFLLFCLGQYLLRMYQGVWATKHWVSKKRRLMFLSYLRRFSIDYEEL